MVNYPLLAKWAGEWLARYLNANIRPAARNRVLRLIECLRELQKERMLVVREKRHIQAWGGGIKFCNWTSDKRVAPLFKEANHLLSRYHFFWQLPFFFKVLPDGKASPMQAEPQGGWSTRPQNRPQRPVGIDLQKLQTSETTAVTNILRVMEAEKLERLRQCLGCGNWYMAWRDDQGSCGLAPCEKRAAKLRNPPDPAKNREYVRKNRKREEVNGWLDVERVKLEAKPGDQKIKDKIAKLEAELKLLQPQKRGEHNAKEK
jgi:hypothetical protein